MRSLRIHRLSWRYGRLRAARRWTLRVLAGGVIGFLLATVVSTASMRWIDPVTSAFMLQAQLAARSQGRHEYRLRHYWVDWEHISPHAKVAVIAAEDQRFPSHAGFDLESIADAVYERVKKERQRGASTITQQVAKNLFLWPGKSFLRKGLEAHLTVLIELFWPKERVLEVYLNVAQFGDGIYGIEAASLVYYRKSAAELTAREAATLAAVLPNPMRLRVDRPSSYVKSRTEWILSQMRRLGGPRFLRSLAGG